MDTINETNVRFRGKALLDLTHEETREALIQALNEVARLQAPPSIVQWAITPGHEPSPSGGYRATSSSISNR